MKQQKLLTVTVPCYNSQAYMRKALDSLLTGGEALDIIVIDDGSKDDTGRIADEYAAAHPGIVRVVHQENGGHGAGINRGIALAEGIWFKVLDSDDRADPAALKALLDDLRRLADDPVDLVVHDYVYDRPEREAVHRIRYRGAFPERKRITWDEAKRMSISTQFMIHALCYRTQVLRDMGLVLPEHCFYEDNLYIYRPLPRVKTLYYCPEAVYGYFVGRSDQSANHQVLLKHIDNITDIAEQMTCSYTWAQMQSFPKKLRRYMLNNACGNLCTAGAQQHMIHTGQGKALHHRMVQTIRNFDPELFRAIRHNLLGFAGTSENPAVQNILVFFYHTVRKVIGTN